jgi:glucose/arabinose dehydrogenase
MKFLLIVSLMGLGFIFHPAYASVADETSTEGFKIRDPVLKAELVVDGLRLPTNMAFLGPNDILVLERWDGTVQRIVNGQMLSEPLLDANVAHQDGMLGIAAYINETNSYVFLYYTETQTRDGEDEEGKQALGNRIYRYELVDNRLINPKLLLDLPATPGPLHHGGEITIGPDGNIYAVVGEISADSPETRTKAQNYEDGPEPDGRAGILRVTRDGQIVNGKGILGDEYPLNIYYAYGIRNGFGMDFDPVTGKLWATENGPDYGDEINLVEPGFNSGFEDAIGAWWNDEDSMGQVIPEVPYPDGMVNFDKRGRYSNPELTWEDPVGPTALIFFNSDSLGKKYENDMFVADIVHGYIYDFNLNQNRTEIDIRDKVIPSNSEAIQSRIIAEFKGGVSDLQIGPDGYLYVLTHFEDEESAGKIYRILPAGTRS